MMNPEIKEKWCQALESGEFQQGRYRLRSYDDKYCCLGVLMELASREDVVPKASIISGWNHYQYGSSSHGLSKAAVEWAGLKDDKGEGDVTVRLSNGELAYLSILNDSAQLSFSEIAKLIREQL